MAGYSKEFIIGAYLHRFRQAGIDTEQLEKIAARQYDEQGKDLFRKYASVDASACAVYKKYLSLLP
jgi:hypothetical protein